MSVTNLHSRQASGIFSLESLATALGAAGCGLERYPERLHVSVGGHAVIVETESRSTDEQGRRLEAIRVRYWASIAEEASPELLSDIADRFGLGYVVPGDAGRLEFGCAVPVYDEDVFSQQAALELLRVYVPLIPGAALAALSGKPVGAKEPPEYRHWSSDSFDHAVQRLAQMGVSATVDEDGEGISADFFPPDDDGTEPVLASPVRMRMTLQATHPVVGPGLKFITRHDVAGVPHSHLPKLAKALNKYEVAGAMPLAATGAWSACGSYLIYGGIVPDVMGQHVTWKQLPANPCLQARLAGTLGAAADARIPGRHDRIGRSAHAASSQDRRLPHIRPDAATLGETPHRQLHAG